MAKPLAHKILSAARASVNEGRWLLALRMLPPQVAWFQVRARRLARRTGDQFSLASATRPGDLARLLTLAHGRAYVVELGTGTAWTSIALALADRRRTVTTYDPEDRPERQRYLELADRSTRQRVEFLHAAGADGPSSDRPVEMLYVDSSHARDQTIEELRVWSRVLAPGALVVLDDYIHPLFEGVRQAVAELGLAGEQCGTLFVHEVPPA